MIRSCDLERGGGVGCWHGTDDWGLPNPRPPKCKIMSRRRGGGGTGGALGRGAEVQQDTVPLHPLDSA